MADHLIRLTIIGTPQPQGSKTGYVVNGRAVLAEGKGPGRANHGAWRHAVAQAARDYLTAYAADLPRRTAEREAAGKPPPSAQPIPDSGPLFVVVRFYMPKPKSRPKWQMWPTTRPDIDKLLRALLDGLKDGGLLSDDGRVGGVHMLKAYAIDHPPCAVVEIDPTWPAKADLLFRPPPWDEPAVVSA